MGPTLHRTAVGLQEVLVDCSGTEGEEKTPEKAFLSKKAALLQLVDQRPVTKTIVFCNKIETCRDVENALGRHDRSGTKLTVLPYHAALSQEARLESMQQFLESQPSKSLFLVCTDRLQECWRHARSGEPCYRVQAGSGKKADAAGKK